METWTEGMDKETWRYAEIQTWKHGDMDMKPGDMQN
jgi:hypothetical protein